MSKLTWHNSGDNRYETGVDMVAIQVPSAASGSDVLTAWNGVSSITEKPEGAEATAIYADNIKYLNLFSVENFKASIEAYTYPAVFNKCLGIEVPVAGMFVPQQTHQKFNLMFRTKQSNDLDQESYKYHFIYNCRVGVSESQYQTINDSPEAITFSWDIETTNVDLSNCTTSALKTLKSTAHITVDGAGLSSAAVTAIENLWDNSLTSKFPTPDAIYTAASTT